jgi:hypothetical protein
MNLTDLQTAWAIYFAGSLGCVIAAWMMFLWAWRFVRYTAVITVMTILLTPYAIDPQTMTMAPAIYTMAFDGIALGLDAIKPLIKLMLGIWLIAMILMTAFVLLTRKSDNEPGSPSRRSSAKSSRRYHEEYEPEPRRNERRMQTEPARRSRRGLSQEEYNARNELLAGEIPIRAIRD